ncbi:MAG: hypothetical protein SF051_09380 [Elusimicrobiota bacterium]|nr:hypothetical protein [Elusimicrobiota bacterium]
MRPSLLLAALLAGAPARAADWLVESEAAAAAAPIPAEPAAPPPKADFLPHTPASRLFSADIPTKGWWPMEEEGPDGSVFYLFGPDSPSGSFRAVLSVRAYDKDSSLYADAKKHADLLRKSDDAVSRTATAVRPLRVGNGVLARTFEVVETRRLPFEQSPSFPEELHHYVAILPNGDGYFVLRLASVRTDYLEHRDMFVRFLKTFRLLGSR